MKNLGVRLLVAGLVLATPAAAWSQGAGRTRVPEFLTSLKVGQWVRLKGVVHKDLSVLCTEVRLLTGDFLDDDWALRGRVTEVDKRKQVFFIQHFEVRLAKDVEFDSDEGTLSGFQDIRPGMLIEVEGTHLEDGTFQAGDVDDDTAEITKHPELEDRLEVVAKVERVDSGKRRITAMGTLFLVTEKTQFKSVIR